MFPTWPAKSELGHKTKKNASPKAPEGGGQSNALMVNLFLQECFSIKIFKNYFLLRSSSKNNFDDKKKQVFYI